MDQAHFLSPFGKFQMVIEIFFDHLWQLIFQGDLNIYEFLNASLWFIIDFFFPFGFCVFTHLQPLSETLGD
jgi:hypothetical protein